MLTIVLIVLLVMALGGGGYGYSRKWGYASFSPLGILAVVVLILFLTGRLA